jgi:hypothetical protein
MMKRFTIATWLVVVIGMFDILSSSSVLAQSNYKYAYLVEQKGELTIRVVDPLSPQNPSDLMTTSIPDNMVFIDVYPSPDGQWIALAFSNGNQSLIRLINAVTLATNDITGGTFYSESLSQLEERIVLLWSPDSTHFAFNTFHNNQGMDNYVWWTDIYVYTVSNGSLVNLTTDNALQFDTVWKPDSSGLIVFTDDCTTSCISTLDVYNIASNTRQTSIGISSITQGGGTGDAAICNLAWSPDGQYISLMASCDLTATSSFREIYAINILQGTITPVTSFTSQFTSPDPFAIAFADYATIWYDAQTLLIGIRFANPATQGTRTLLYEFPSLNQTILNAETAQAWTRDATSQKLAFRSIWTNLTSIQPHDGVVKIATLDSNSMLNYLYDGVAGCDLTWSPDGAFLAYAFQGMPFTGCDFLTQKIIFVDAATSQSGEHIIQHGEASTIERLYTIGWIATQ